MTKYTLLIVLMHILLSLFLIYLIHKFCKKKNIKISLFILLGIFILYLITLSIDIINVNNLKTPIFAIEDKLYCLDCENKSSYKGLGYQVDINYYNERIIEKTEMRMFNKVIAGAIQLISSFDAEEIIASNIIIGRIIKINDSNYTNPNYKYSIIVEPTDKTETEETIVFYHNFDNDFEEGQTVQVYHHEDFDYSKPPQGYAINIEILY